MNTHQAPKHISPSSSQAAIRLAGIAVLSAGLSLVSACAVGAEDGELTDDQSLATEDCDLALDAYPDDDLAYLSCILQQPVDPDGVAASERAGEKIARRRARAGLQVLQYLLRRVLGYQRVLSCHRRGLVTHRVRPVSLRLDDHLRRRALRLGPGRLPMVEMGNRRGSAPGI